MQVKYGYELALAAAEELASLSDDELLVQLGLRVEDERNPGGDLRKQQFSADFQQNATDMLSADDLKRVGRLWWSKLEPQLLGLVCDEHSEERGRITGGRSVPQIAASLATAAVISAVAPPAWVIVATTILAAKIVETGLDSVCQVWGESMNRPAG